MDRTVRLWVDDARDMPEDYNIHVETYQDAIDILDTYEVSAISLDHDLGDVDTRTGYDIACWIEKHATLGLPRIEWSIHSVNPVGVKRMEAAMTAADRYWRAADAVILRHELFKPVLIVYNRDYNLATEFFRIRHPELGNKTPFQLIIDGDDKQLSDFIKKIYFKDNIFKEDT